MDASSARSANRIRSNRGHNRACDIAPRRRSIPQRSPSTGCTPRRSLSARPVRKRARPRSPWAVARTKRLPRPQRSPSPSDNCRPRSGTGSPRPEVAESPRRRRGSARGGRRAAVCGVWCGAFAVSAARERAPENPGPKANQENPASDLHGVLSYEKRTVLATRGNFAEAVLVSSGFTAALGRPGTRPRPNMTIDTPPPSHSRFGVGMCDLARLEGHAPVERSLSL